MYYTDGSTLTSLSVCDDGKILTGTDNGLVCIPIAYQSDYWSVVYYNS